MTIVNTETGEILEPRATAALVPINATTIARQATAIQEMAVSGYLEQARDWLATAVERTGPEEIAGAKAQIATAAEATKQLGLSKEIQLDAQEMVRRAEYALGKAIRKGQEGGTVLNQYEKRHVHDRWNGGRIDTASSNKASPSDFASNTELRGLAGRQPGIYDLADDVSPEQFDEAVARAKDEGNVSRANVVRKIREKKTPPSPTRKDRADHMRDLAEKGYSSRQIATELGVHFDTVRGLARDFNIDVPADAIVGRTRRIDHTHMVESTVTDLVNTVEFIEAHIDLNQVDLAEADEWVSSLTDSIRALNRFVKQIKEKTHV